MTRTSKLHSKGGNNEGQYRSQTNQPRFQAEPSNVKHASCSDFTHSDNPVTEDDPYGVNLDNATKGAART